MSVSLNINLLIFVTMIIFCEVGTHTTCMHLCFTIAVLFCHITQADSGPESQSGLSACPCKKDGRAEEMKSFRLLPRLSTSRNLPLYLLAST
jgi:hypothetical protein